MTITERGARHIRHDLKMRLLEVRRVEPVTPGMRRVILGGEALAGFVSAAYDDHAKIFFPPPGQDRPLLPALGPNGMVYPEGAPKPAARDYTPRRFDAAAMELAIDFALHRAGPAASWAAQAAPGQFLGVGGPRGSFVIADDFDWYLLAGDETALPAIGRRLEELPAGARAIVVAEVADAGEEQRFDSRARVDVIWRHRGGAEPGTPGLLLQAVADLRLPPGEGYAWVAAESAIAKAVRQHLTGERNLRQDRVKAAGYWKRGAAAVHETHDA
mgnify:CR=1 FL=1